MMHIRSCQDPVTESGTEYNSSRLMYLNERLFFLVMRSSFDHLYDVISVIAESYVMATELNVSLLQFFLTVCMGMIFLNSSSPFPVVSCT